MSRIYWCVGLLVATFARAVFGDSAHLAAPTRSAVFVVVWVIAFLVYASIMYFRPLASRGMDYVVLTGLLLTITFEVAGIRTSQLARGHLGLTFGGGYPRISLGRPWGR